MTIREAGPEHIPLVRELFQEYAAMLGEDLCFQGFAEELASLPGKYSRPGGCILLGFDQEQPAGCVALRAAGPGVCEMKRLFIRPAFRGRGWGRELAIRIMAEARNAGYSQMVLDTLDRLREAHALYRSLGFADVPAYYANPLAGVVYMQRAL